MNSEEIKKTYGMRDILLRYGMEPNRAGFICCPFHKEKTASMKIYPDGYHCFGCGAHGDIFQFVMEMEACDFKAAFQFLGGTYKKPNFESKLTLYRQKKKAVQREADRKMQKDKMELTCMLIDLYRDYVDRSEPLSEVWCDCYNALQYQLYVYDALREEVMSCKIRKN